MNLPASARLRRTAPRRYGIVLAAIAVFATAAARAAPNADCVREAALRPEEVVEVAVTTPRLLLEEIGTDVEYRWRATEAFAPLATPPDRLGFDLLTAASERIALRSRAGQGGGRARLSFCVDEGAALFFSGLAQLQRHHLEMGRDAAKAALPPLQYLLRWSLDPAQAAWVGSAYANALASAGENLAAEQAFLDSGRNWQLAGRPERAAIALMAAGDNASRSSRFDSARRWLTDAAAELHRLDVPYYALRSESSLCNVLSRESRYRDAIACEQRMIGRWSAQQERREAAVREISLANLWLSVNDPEQAQRHFLNAQTAEALLSPVVRARLDISLGSYQQSQGNLPGAAQLFARAAARLGDKGLPAEQKNLDLKLAGLAYLAGAIPEQVRLLEAASQRLSRQQDPLALADVSLRLSQALLYLGESTRSLAASQLAATLCTERGNAACVEQAQLSTIRVLQASGQYDRANTELARLQPSDAAAGLVKAVLSAESDLQQGDAERAWSRLQLPAGKNPDPEIQVQLARLRALALAKLGRRDAALDQLALTLDAQSARAAAWPSAALRISARNRLAELQAAFFDLLLQPQPSELGTPDFARLLDAIHAASVNRLFAQRANAQLPATLRSALSAAINDGTLGSQRELLLALADAGTTHSTPAVPDTPAARNGDATRGLVILPLAGENEFHLVAWQAGKARRCLHWPLPRYRQLVREFDAALDGEEVDLAALQREAAQWHQALRDCQPGTPAASRWQVVLTAGTPSLPWTWIAAATRGAEPSLTSTFVFPQQSPPRLPRPDTLLLLDLDMPNVAPLPLASSEIETLQQSAANAGIATRHVHSANLPAEAVLQEMAAATAVHVVGHANPAAFGQLYQGLWYESAGKPVLLTYPEIAATPLHADLVVLSACGTRYSDQHRYGATSRLAEALIAAGSRHVVAASNPLSDAAAPLWTRTFHRALWRDGDAAAAAREARAALRNSPHFRHPRFWAGIDYYAAIPAESNREAVTPPPPIP